jgi:hypothetical protein
MLKKVVNTGPKMLEEFAKRQELKKNENWFFDMKENLDAFLQIQFKISPYLTVNSLLEVNHCLNTQLNECLNRSVSALAPTDRSYNGSMSLVGRIAIVVSRNNLGHTHFLSRICSKLGLSSTDSLQVFAERSDKKTARRRECQDIASSKMKRSAAKKRKRTEEVQRQSISNKKKMTYIGHGGGKRVQHPVKRQHPGCFGTNHKTNRSKRCKYHGLDEQKRQEQIAIFKKSTVKIISP